MEFGDEIIKILDYLCQKIGMTVDWTNENVLPYVEELCAKYVEWETATSMAWIGIAIAALVVILIAAAILHALQKKEYIDIDHMEWIVFGCAVVIAFIIIVTQIFDIIECQTFPEKAIYEYIQLKMNSTT